MYPDISRLRKAGYAVEEKSPWHFQVSQNGVTVNVWPTKRKYMREFGGGASFYTDPVAAVASVVGAPGKKETREERAARLRAFWEKETPVPADPDADAAWRYELDLTVAQVDRAIKRAESMDF